MKYNEIKNSYTCPFNRLGSDYFYAFFQDGYKLTIEYPEYYDEGDYTIYDILHCINYVLDGDTSHGSLVGVYTDLINPNTNVAHHILFSTLYPEFWNITPVGGVAPSAVNSITLIEFSDAPRDDTLNDYGNYESYYVGGTQQQYTNNVNYQYSSFSKQLGYGSVVTIDRSNEEDLYTFKVDNYEFDLVAYLIGSNVDYNSFQFSYGTPLKDYAQTEYQNGFNDGFNAGVSNGYDNGWENGYTQGHSDGYYEGFGAGSDLDSGNAVLDGFTIASKSFSSLNTVLNLEIFPHVTLGVVFSVPFVFLIIALAFRLLKR